jgi:hypothetical protein
MAAKRYKVFFSFCFGAAAVLRVVSDSFLCADNLSVFGLKILQIAKNNSSCSASKFFAAATERAQSDFCKCRL